MQITDFKAWRDGYNLGKERLLEEIQTKYEQLFADDFKNYLFNELPELMASNKDLAARILEDAKMLQETKNNAN